jgi:hypothetical protein
MGEAAMWSLRGIGYLTAMIESAAGSSESAVRIAAALQAGYFCGASASTAHKSMLPLTKVRARIETHRQAGDRFEAHELQRQLRELEDERGQLDWLISRLDRRYRTRGPTWSSSRASC